MRLDQVQDTQGQSYKLAGLQISSLGCANPLNIMPRDNKSSSIVVELEFIDIYGVLLLCQIIREAFQVALAVKKLPCQNRHKRHRFDPWVGKIPWRRAWQPTPVFLLGESHGQRSLAAVVHRATKSWTQLKQLSTHPHKISLLLKEQVIIMVWQIGGLVKIWDLTHSY